MFGTSPLRFIVFIFLFISLLFLGATNPGVSVSGEKICPETGPPKEEPSQPETPSSYPGTYYPGTRTKPADESPYPPAGEYISVGESTAETDCCEFTSLSIANVWDRRHSIQVIITSSSGRQLKVIPPNSTDTFTGDLGECVRITVKSTDPASQNLLIEDVRVCCKDLKKGRAPRFFSINIVNFTSKPCPKGGVPSPPPETPGGTKPPPPEVAPPPVLLKLGINITKCPYYWMPKVGNRVRFTAKIYKWVPGRGWVYPGAPRVITFKLSGVSKEKGVCLNKGDQLTPDLYFKGPKAGFVLSGGEGKFFDTARTKTAVTEADLTVLSDDYGSFGWIKASAPNCEDIAPNGPVSIPFDDNANTIADWALQDDHGAKPEKDEDANPTLDGEHGDGFSNYEEYRGFFVGLTHRRTDITTKDLFVNDRTTMGLGHYPSATRIECHVITNDQMDGHRVVNFNRNHATSEETKKEGQHGLILRWAGVRELPEGYIGMSFQNRAKNREGIFGPPINVYRTVLAVGYWSKKLVAHELGHSTCARHHGEASTDPRMVFAPEDNIRYDNRFSLAERNEARRLSGQPPLKLCGRTLPAQFYWHPKGAQQSGNIECVMKYEYFNLYTEDGLYQCWPPNLEGTIFCTSRIGTGYNAGGLVGGNATKGDCLHQLRVKDKEKKNE